MQTGWVVKPIPPPARHAVTLVFNGEEEENVILHFGSQDAPALQDYLNWLNHRLPYEPADREHWLPDRWIQRADEQGLPEQYIKDTGKPAFKRSGKTSLRKTTDPNEPRTQPPGPIVASMEAEDPKHFLRVIAKGQMVKFMCPFSVRGQGYVKHYFSDDVSDWIPEFDDATACKLSDYLHQGVIDLNDCPLGTEAIVLLNPDGTAKEEVKLGQQDRWKVTDSYVPDTDAEDMANWNPPDQLEAEDPKSVFRKLVGKGKGADNAEAMRRATAFLEEQPSIYAVEFTRIRPDTIYIDFEILDPDQPGFVNLHPFGPFTEVQMRQLMNHPKVGLVNWAERQPIGEAEDPKAFLKGVSAKFKSFTIMWKDQHPGSAPHFTTFSEVFGADEAVERLKRNLKVTNSPYQATEILQVRENPEIEFESEDPKSVFRQATRRVLMLTAIGMRSGHADDYNKHRVIVQQETPEEWIGWPDPAYRGNSEHWQPYVDKPLHYPKSVWMVIKEAEDPKRFLQQYGRDFSYSYDFVTNVYYVTPLNDKAVQFIASAPRPPCC